MSKPIIYWIDLFSGAGGTSTGIHLAEANAGVVACVNHDSTAIASHLENHPDCLHFIEDIRDFAVVVKLKKLVKILRERDPSCHINIWASLECTNYSKAKGGLPRDADSRTLAWDLLMYLEHLKPDYLYIENVAEFLAWGPLDENGRPISMKKGCDYTKWVEAVKQYGFSYDYRILNAADYGAAQIRRRYFGVFAYGNLPIDFPEGTHYDPKKFRRKDGLFEFGKEPWRAVKEVLELHDQGNSIFTRKKDLVDNTLERIYAGLQKFAGETAFMKKYYSGRPKGKVTSIERPAGTLTTACNQAIVQPLFLTEYYGNGRAQSLERPCPTVVTKDRFALNYLLYDYSNFTASFLNRPAGTVTTNPKHKLMSTWLMDPSFRNVGTPVTEPSPTVLACRKHKYIVSPEWLTDTQYGRVGQSLDKPSFTLIARMDKKPPYYIKTEVGIPTVEFLPDDSLIMFKIKHFMRVHGITDIKMRMLNLLELKRIQGFPDDYKMRGTITEQKKHIGNAVQVDQAVALINANYNSLCA